MGFGGGRENARSHRSAEMPIGAQFDTGRLLRARTGSMSANKTYGPAISSGRSRNAELPLAGCVAAARQWRTEFFGKRRKILIIGFASNARRGPG
jgi:hypothetical protein